MHGKTAGRLRRLRGQLDSTLFLSAPPSRNSLASWEKAAILLSFLALGVVLQLFRLGPSNAFHSVWAEDGPVFLQGAMTHGFLDSLTSTYAGYLVVVQRLIGEVGDLAPLRDAPAAISLTSAFVVALSGVVVWVASAGHIRNPYLRGTLVALTVLSPVASLEALASGTYVSWYMGFGVFWLLLWRPRTTWGAALGGLFILATGLSSPAIVFFLPLAALRAVAIRDRRDALLVGSFALAAAIQLPVTALSDETGPTPTWTVDILTTFLQRVVDGSVLGEALGGTAWEQFGWAFLIAISLATALYLLLAASRATSGRLLAAIAVATAIAMFVVSAYQRAVGTAMMWPAGLHHGLGGRYAIIPSLLLISAAFILLEGRRTRRRPYGLSPLALATVAVLGVALASSFDVRDSSARGTPAWDASLEASAAGCRAQSLTEAAVAISPPGWGMTISCERLESTYGAPAAPQP